MFRGPSRPSAGFIKKTAPSEAVIPSVAVQESKSMPMLPSNPLESPSVMLTVSHESYAADADTATKAGLTPPTWLPNGVASW